MLTTIPLTLISSVNNPSSMANLWLLINQVQLFLLIFLSKAFIPNEVQIVLNGINFGLNPYNYLHLNDAKGYSASMDDFNFPLSNSSLENLNIKSNSTLYNASSFFWVLSLVALLNVSLALFSKYWLKWKTEGKWYRFALTIISTYLVQKLTIYDICNCLYSTFNCNFLLLLPGCTHQVEI